jgi:dipeptidase E
MTMRLLLLSNSTSFGGSYLDHYADAIATHFGKLIRRVLFVPYALHNHDAYASKVRTRFNELGYELESVHEARSGPRRAVDVAEAIFIGGGNTFRLLDRLWREDLIESIRRRAVAGIPYMGVSAGSNVACPTIKTTNDMPIVRPPTFLALGLVPFQVNPHYVDPVPGTTHMGETREQRIAEFHEENQADVVGLREGAWLVVDGGRTTLNGANGARLFRRGQPAVEIGNGEVRLESKGG